MCPTSHGFVTLGSPYLVVNPDPGPANSVAHLAEAVLVGGGLERGREEDPETLLRAVALVRVPAAVEEEIVGDLLRASVALRGGAVRKSASCNNTVASQIKRFTTWLNYVMIIW